MIVLDCCAAVGMILDTKEGQALKSLALKNEEIISSKLLLIELGSALSKYVKADLLDIKQAEQALRDIDSLVNRFIDLSENYLEAFSESLKYDHSAYDMVYLTLARRNAATLLTLDKSLVKLCKQLKVCCVQIIE
jgi:predicted nucleic acid-binding protein